MSVLILSSIFDGEKEDRLKQLSHIPKVAQLVSSKAWTHLSRTLTLSSNLHTVFSSHCCHYSYCRFGLPQRKEEEEDLFHLMPFSPGLMPACARCIQKYSVFGRKCSSKQKWLERCFFFSPRFRLSRNWDKSYQLLSFYCLINDMQAFLLPQILVLNAEEKGKKYGGC